MAKSPGGREVGRVSIRALPDTSTFKAELKKSLDQIEKDTTLTISVGVNLDQARADLRKFQAQWDGANVDLDADADTDEADAKLADAARNRNVKLTVSVDTTSLAKVKTVFAGLLTRNPLAGLTAALPKITATSLGIASIGAVGLTAVRGLAGVVTELGQLIPLIALLPGLLGGAAVGVLTLVLAFKDAPTVLGSALTAYKGLATVVQQNFWDQAATPIRTLLTTLLPQLRAGLAETSTSIGIIFKGFSNVLVSALKDGGLKPFFDGVAAGFDAAGPGLETFLNDFVSLLNFGTQYLPIFGNWVSDIAYSFDGWLAGVEASGELNTMITTGIGLLKNMFGVVGDIGAILKGVFLSGTGADPFGALNVGLAAVASVVTSPGFQTALSTIFDGASLGAKGLAAALGPIGSLLGSLAPTIGTVLSGAGTAVGSVLSQIAGALSQPAFATGLTAFFAGIESGLAAIGPALPAVAAALGTVGAFAGALATQVGPILGAALKIAAPLVTSLLTAVQPLLPVLGTALLSILQALSPLFAAIATTVLPPLVSLIKTLAPVIASVVTAFLPLITAILPPVMALFNALLPIITPIISILGPIAQLIAAVLAPAIQLLLPILKPVISILQALSPLFQAAGVVIGAVAGIISTVLVGAVKVISDLISGNLSQAGKDLGSIWTGIVGIVSGAFNSLTAIINPIINNIIDGVNGLIGGIDDALTGLKTLTGGAITLKIPKIPHVTIPKLAAGATVLPRPGGTLVTLAEAGQSETVVNTGVINKLIEQANARLAAPVASAQFPTEITLVDSDGTFIARMKTVASGVVKANDMTSKRIIAGKKIS